jgi:hypothetical protein
MTRTSELKMNARRMMTMTTMITIILRTNSSHKTAHLWLVADRGLPQPLKAMAGHQSLAQQVETLSYPRIKRCRTY